jgi:hypothetical protein
MSSQFSNQEVSVHSVFASATASVTASGLMSGSSSASPSDIPSVNHNAGTTGVTHAVEFRLSTAGTATITLDYEINEEAAANGSLVTSFSRGAVELSGSASGQSFFQRAGFDSTDDPSGRGAHFGTLSIALPLSGPQDTVNFLVRGTTWAYEPNPAVPEVATPLMFASGLLTLLCCCRGGHSGRRIKDRRTPA